MVYVAILYALLVAASGNDIGTLCEGPVLQPPEDFLSSLEAFTHGEFEEVARWKFGGRFVDSIL